GRREDPVGVAVPVRARPVRSEWLRRDRRPRFGGRGLLGAAPRPTGGSPAPVVGGLLGLAVASSSGALRGRVGRCGLGALVVVRAGPPPRAGGPLLLRGRFHGRLRRGVGGILRRP